jgi:hypothetical protein
VLRYARTAVVLNAVLGGITLVWATLLRVHEVGLVFLTLVPTFFCAYLGQMKHEVVRLADASLKRALSEVIPVHQRRAFVGFDLAGMAIFGAATAYSFSVDDLEFYENPLVFLGILISTSSGSLEVLRVLEWLNRQVGDG